VSGRAFATAGLLVALVVASLAAAPAGAAAQGAGAAAEHSLRSPVTDETFYFIMADRFENGTTANDLGGLPADRLTSGFDPTARGFYHGGDLRGIIRRLDYIAGLGTTAIWLTPSFKNRAVQRPVTPTDQPSAGYHGYWVTDFTRIDPHLGTNAELAELVAAAHERGMKVYFDIITNHTADVIEFREGARPAYVSKDAAPYRTAGGTPFDDRDFAGTSTFPALDPNVSFPYTPLNPPGSDRKTPDWLNDVTLYHNRGDTTFTGEDSLYGDFFGLDDLFTEHPRVVRGMIDIYEAWIRDFGIDGFRIDTMRHVNDQFWQQFGPEVLRFARDQGKSEFFMFGEVADTSKPYTSHFSTTDRMQAVLDFPFQAAAQDFAANSGTTERLADFFADDDWYTDADSNAYQLPTFLGNHDMGRIGRFVSVANAGASDAELLARDRLAHELMYFSRGDPVVYYGDEQGFTGDGGDQLARQDMFPSRVAEYNDDDLIGTDATTARSNFDRRHPLYRRIARLARVATEHPALRNGAQQHRYATDGPGIYAFSRIGRQEQREYVVALNNSEQTRTARIPTYVAGRRFVRVYGNGPTVVRTTSERRLRVSVPPLSTVVYESSGRIPRSEEAPSPLLASPSPSADSRARMEVHADLPDDSPYEVTFLAKVADGDWRSIGTDDNAPYRVYHDVSGHATATAVQYRAVVLDNAGHTRASRVRSTEVPAPRITIGSPAQNAKVRGRVRLLANTDPERADQSVTFYRRVGSGPWTAIGTDTSSPDYVVFDDISGLGLATGAQIRYRAVLAEPDGNEVQSRVRTVTVAPPPVTTAIVHYRRPNADYAGWGLHLFGTAIADSVAQAVSWDHPWPFTAVDSFGARFEIPLKDDTSPVSFIVHLPGRDDVPTGREPGGDRSFVPVDHPEIWLLQGDPTVYFAPPPGT
jgi:alpha-amylase